MLESFKDDEKLLFKSISAMGTAWKTCKEIGGMIKFKVNEKENDQDTGSYR